MAKTAKQLEREIIAALREARNAGHQSLRIPAIDALLERGYSLKRAERAVRPYDNVREMHFGKVRKWDESFGGDAGARRRGVPGRLAEVNDGTYTWIRSTNEDDIDEVFADYASTASYDGPVTLRGRIVEQDGTVVDSGRYQYDPNENENG